MRKFRIGKTAAAATAAALLAGGAGAYATIPGWYTGTIDSCYDSTGALRVIDREAGATCPAGTTALSFNQKGQTGPTGMRGPSGPPGPVGLHWLRVADNGTIKNSGEPASNWTVWDYGDYQIIKNSTVDLRQCALFGSAYTGYHQLASVSRYGDEWNGMVVVMENGTDPNHPVLGDVDISFACKT